MSLKVTGKDTKRAMRRSKAKYNSPIEITLDIIGGKWKCVILGWLSDTKRFSELKQLMPGITQKVLAQQLRELETDRLIYRKTYRESPPWIGYSLTSYGETVRSITDLMYHWGKAHKPEYQFSQIQLDNWHFVAISDKPETCDRLLKELKLRRIRATAIAAKTAIEQLNQLQPDIVIMDTKISDEDRVALLNQVKVVEKLHSKQIVAIAFTTGDEEYETSFSSGSQLHLAKPIEFTEFSKLIEAVINIAIPNGL